MMVLSGLLKPTVLGVKEKIMALFKVTTLVQFKHVYFVEGKSLEHALDEVTMRDSGSEDDHFEEAVQEYLGETIVESEQVTKQYFNDYLNSMKDNKRVWASHWMGDALIRKIKYKDSGAQDTITVTPWSGSVDYQTDNTMDAGHEAFKQMGTSLILGQPDIGNPDTREASRYNRWSRFQRGY